MIFKDVHLLRKHMDKCLEKDKNIHYAMPPYRRHRYFVTISGGFDPLHSGHLNYMREASELYIETSPLDCILTYNTHLIVIVNGDGFLRRKKGYVFMKEDERAEIIDALQYVRDVLIWDDGTQLVGEALKVIKPVIFANGGDRTKISELPRAEVNACEECGIQLVLGVGGSNKKQSSSKLVEGSPCQIKKI